MISMQLHPHHVPAASLFQTSGPGLQLFEMIVVPIVAKPTTMTTLMISMRFQLRNSALQSMAE